MEITSQKIKLFRTIFKGREDVFAFGWGKGSSIPGTTNGGFLFPKILNLTQ